MPTLSFIGCGKLGRSLGYLFQRQGVFSVRQVLTRTQDSANAAVRFIGAGQPIADIEDLQPADVFIIAAPDRRLDECARQLAASGVLDERTTVLHCSGALSSELLAPCAAAGAQVASAHPLLSFADPAQVVKHFHCHCALEGDVAAVRMLAVVFARIGAQTLEIPTEAKLRYHAAAVIASNYLVTLTEQALQAVECAGLTRAEGRELLLPLMHQTLDNLARQEPKAALTGPVARADWQLVKTQQASLAAARPALGTFYAAMANATAQLAGHLPPFEAP